MNDVRPPATEASARARAAERRGRRPLRVSIVLPAYNEEANLEQAIGEATAAAERLFEAHEVVVVDDGSTDATGSIADRIAESDDRVRVIHHDGNRGYGETLIDGLLAAHMEYVFFTDADLQFDPSDLERFLPFVGTVDVVAGYRLDRKDPLRRRLMAYAWNLLVRVLFYVPVRDIDCAFKLFDRRVLRDLELESVGAMVNTELMVKLGRSGASVVEVGVQHRPRCAGEAQGSNLSTIAMAFRELRHMRRELSRLDGRGL